MAMLGGNRSPLVCARASPGRASRTRVPSNVETPAVLSLTMEFSSWANHSSLSGGPGSHGDATNQDDDSVHRMCRLVVAWQRGAALREDLSPRVAKPRRLLAGSRPPRARTGRRHLAKRTLTRQSDHRTRVGRL